MTTLRWVDAFSLKATGFDEPHRQLFDDVRAAISAVQHERYKEAAQAVASLTEDARCHFRGENILMHDMGYPGYYNHFEQHRRLLLGLERLQVALALRRPDVDATVHYLRSWFTLHLLKDDHALADYLGQTTH